MIDILRLAHWSKVRNTLRTWEVAQATPVGFKHLWEPASIDDFFSRRQSGSAKDALVADPGEPAAQRVATSKCCETVARVDCS